MKLTADPDCSLHKHSHLSWTGGSWMQCSNLAEKAKKNKQMEVILFVWLCFFLYFFSFGCLLFFFFLLLKRAETRNGMLSRKCIYFRNKFIAELGSFCQSSIGYLSQGCTPTPLKVTLQEIRYELIKNAVFQISLTCNTTLTRLLPDLHGKRISRNKLQGFVIDTAVLHTAPFPRCRSPSA